MVVVGLDVGQRGLGFASVELSGGTGAAVVSYTKSFYAENTFVSRFDVAAKVLAFAHSPKADLVVIEEYAKMQHSHVAFGMGEFGGIIRTLFYEARFPLVLCPVPSMRGFYEVPRNAKGQPKINSKKWVREKLRDIFPAHRLSTTEAKGQDDEIDALGYAYIGCCYAGYAGHTLTKKQRLVLERLKRYEIGAYSGASDD